MSHNFTNGIPFKTRSISATSLVLALGVMALAAAPAYAGSNADLEVFGGGLAKTQPPGPVIGQNGLLPGAGSMSVKRDALEQVTWYKSRRQVSIEDNSPIVTNRGGGGSYSGPGQLTPASFGGNGALAGAMGAPRYLTPAHLGPMVRSEPGPTRPLMHPRQAGLGGQRAVANGLSASTPAQQKPPAQASSYRNYSTAPPASVNASADAEAVHMRQVKARLLPGSSN